MPRKGRMKGKDVLRALQRLGFHIVRIKGSHHFLRHPDGRTTTVPVHGNEEIGIGLLGKIMEDAAVTEQQLRDA